MNIPDSLILKFSIESLMIDYWHEVDFNAGRQAHEHFTLDADFTASSGTRYEGRPAIRQFYETLLGSVDAKLRHAVSNLRVVPDGPDRACAQSLLFFHSMAGTIAGPSAPPKLIADVIDICVREADGVWRYASRTIVPLARS